MKFYHGTTEGTWEQIQRDGELLGYSRILSNDRKTVLHEHRVTYLATVPEDAACYGDVILEVEYEPTQSGNANNHFDEKCWQLRVYVPIPLKNIKKIQNVWKKKK